MDFKISELPAYVKALFFVGWLLPAIVSYTTVKVQTQNEIDNLKQAVEQYRNDHDILLLLANDFNTYTKTMDKMNTKREEQLRDMDNKIDDLWLVNADKIAKIKGLDNKRNTN